MDYLLSEGKLTITNNMNGFKKEMVLRKGQIEAINHIEDNFMDNLLIVAPTAWGKTVIAIVYIIKMYNNGLKSVYMSPLKALTAEIVEKLRNIGFNVLEDTGDFRKDPTKDYDNCDVLSTTYERLGSVITNPKNHSVFDDFGLVIIDEIHTLHSDNRGSDLESTIVELKQHTSVSILGMSATANNYIQIAEFIEGEYIYVPVEERPVKQNIYIKYYFSSSHNMSLRERNVILRPVLNELIRENKQALIFCSSRDRCEKLAKYFSGIRKNDPIELAKRSNYTWHHAGVEVYQKKEIEKMFLGDKVKFIFCTPTLAAGVNLPAYCVVIYDAYRYSGLKSQDVPIESLEIEQMYGRAGRPQYGENECDIYIFIKLIDKPYVIEESYIESKMLKDFKMVFNKWITSGISYPDELRDSLKRTLLNVQNDFSELKKGGTKVLKFLIKNGFINRQEDGEFTSTFFGKMTALFRIRPETALHYKIIESEYLTRDFSDLELVATLLNTDEFLDLIRVDVNKDADIINLCIRVFQQENILYELYDERILKAIPLVFTSYFNEKYSARIVLYRNDANTLAGIMEKLLSSAGVIIYNKDLTKRISYLKVMIQNKTLNRDVAILKSVKGLGDVRLNRLFKVKIKSPEAFLRRADTELMRIMNVSKKVLDNIKDGLKQAIKENSQIKSVKNG